ncbi:MAG: antitermination protein NusG [Planctomycetota bacterium]|nr:antitermination protein NusG [Planctomycetota bacterium]
MPILAREPDILPEDLLEACPSGVLPGSRWAAVYTISRREKSLMRHLRVFDIPHYCPLIARRTRSASGRVRESYIPLFSCYVFVLCNAEQRVEALQSNCISRWLDFPDHVKLVSDLRNIRALVNVGAPLTPEARLQTGERVVVQSGPFAGIEGTIVERRGQRHLIVAVDYLQQGASVLLDEVSLKKA